MTIPPLPRRITDRAPWHENRWDCDCGAEGILYALHPYVCPECGCDVRDARPGDQSGGNWKPEVLEQDLRDDLRRWLESEISSWFSRTP